MVVNDDVIAAHGIDFKAVRLKRPFAPDNVVLATHYAVKIIYVGAFMQVELQAAHPLMAVDGPHPVGR